MPNNDIEVFEYFISAEDTASEIDFLAYALFAYKKREWITHFVDNHTKQPAQNEIDNWISNLSPHDLDAMRRDALAFFEESAAEYLHEHIEDQKRIAVNESILNEIKQYTNKWKDFAVAGMMAVLVPVMLGVVVFLFDTFDKKFPFHVVIGGSDN
jgi:hypothetical protein